MPAPRSRRAAGPALLDYFTAGGTNLEGRRAFPRLYALALLATAVLFWLATVNRTPDGAAARGLVEQLAPLKDARVWRFGLYHVLVFGGYVALAQWLIPYYVGAYAMSLATAGLISLVFTVPGGVIRALGGLLSDLFGARTIMYWVLGGSTLLCALLVVPRMNVSLPGEAVLATEPGVVSALAADAVVVDGTRHPLRERPADSDEVVGGAWPVVRRWHEPAIAVGDSVAARTVLARGVTHYYFDADVRVFTVLVMLLGVLMGIGKAAVYKYIPEYFPRDVGIVGGLVGVLGALGGSWLAVAFGYALEWTGVWSTSWVILFVVSGASLVWLHLVVRRLTRQHAPEVFSDIEDRGLPSAIALRLQCPRLAEPATLRLERVDPPGRSSAAGSDTISVRVTGCSLWPDVAPHPCACVEAYAADATPASAAAGTEPQAGRP